MKIEKYSFGMGDRFGKEGISQLDAIIEINKLTGLSIVPVWNKSNREHKIVHTTQALVKTEAEEAVKALNWKRSFYIDADHIGLETVDSFIGHSNFFTIDVAHFIAKPADEESKNEFIKRHRKYIGKLIIPGIEEEFNVTEKFLSVAADKYLLAIQEVAKIFNYIAKKKGKDNFIPEVSMDKCEHPQSPLELFFILAELKFHNVDIQTIAPKFTGLFAKGVDYIGDISVFAKEFDQDVAVIKYASRLLGLPSNLKLSVHSGSDKFSIYSAIKSSLKKFDAGIHVKTAGTTWLEEVIGLAQAGGEGLDIAKTIYRQSMARYDELTEPYATVLDIDKTKLPSPEVVDKWDSQKFASSLIHNKKDPDYNPSFRQLIHVGYKIAVELGDTYYNALDKYSDIVGKNVKNNILERHLKLLFG